jgi:predicted secreted protein
MILPLLFLTLPWAHAEEVLPAGTRIQLSATAEQSVSNDEMIVYYRIEETGASVKKLRQKVNQITARLEERLKSEQVKHKTTGRSLRPLWEKGLFNYKKWTLNQSGQIVSSDLDNMSDWLTDIEALGVKLNQLSFRVSSGKMRQVHDELRLDALKKFRAQAKVLSHGLAAKSFRIIRIQTSGDSKLHVARQPMMAEMSMAKSAAPVMASGESKSSLTVSGEIEVPFTDFPVK